MSRSAGARATHATKRPGARSATGAVREATRPLLPSTGPILGRYCSRGRMSAGRRLSQIMIPPPGIEAATVTA